MEAVARGPAVTIRTVYPTIPSWVEGERVRVREFMLLRRAMGFGSVLIIMRLLGAF
jgi:hypothetical protein